MQLEQVQKKNFASLLEEKLKSREASSKRVRLHCTVSSKVLLGT
jgi:hypothetical protein